MVPPAVSPTGALMNALHTLTSQVPATRRPLLRGAIASAVLAVASHSSWCDNSRTFAITFVAISSSSFH